MSFFILSNIKLIIKEDWSITSMSSVPAEPTNPPNINETTNIIKGVDKVIQQITYFVSNATERIDACIDKTRPSLVVEIQQLREAFDNAKKRGISLNYITEITNENISYCRQLLQIVNELRHIDGVKGNFYISEKEYVAPARFHELGKPASQLIYSNVGEIVENQQYVFDTLWDKATPAELRIRDLEQNTPSEFFEIISTPERAADVFLNLAKTIQKEALLILPHNHSVLLVKEIGILEFIAEAHKNRMAKVKIIYLENKENKEILKTFEMENLKISILPFSLNTNSIIFIVDDREFIRTEIRDNPSYIFKESVGFTIHSNSKPGIDSFKSFFDIIWKQIHLYEELSMSNKKLDESYHQLSMLNKMQNEFINIAAHELRTPIMPILNGMEILEEKLGENVGKYRHEIDIIARNASRLQNLAESILQVSRIESGTFSLSIQSEINFHSLIEQVIEDVEKKFAYMDKEKKVSIVFLPFFDKEKKHKADKGCDIAGDGNFYGNRSNSSDNPNPRPLYVDCDSQKITQVVFNLLDNAMKFTFDGKVFVTTNVVTSHLPLTTFEVSLNNSKEKRMDKENKPFDGLEDIGILVTVLDTGVGIHPTFKSHLFEKFASKSHQGTGLGLYLSKKIIEAHGGKMWYEDPSDEIDKGGVSQCLGNNKKVGTIFKFIIPISIGKKHDIDK